MILRAVVLITVVAHGLANINDLDDLSAELQAEDPLLSGGYFEGDIMGVNANNARRKAQSVHYWPGGIIPFEVVDDMDRSTKGALVEAMSEIQAQTCVKFRGRTRRDRHSVIFTPGMDNQGCGTKIGAKRGSTQTVILGPGCAGKGIILHTLMHLLGFWHEHSRDERDEHISVKFRNIAPGSRKHFKKYTTRDDNFAGEPFDIESIMHISQTAFSKDGELKTITPKGQPAGTPLGQRSRLSDGDIVKIQRIYCSHLENNV